MADALRGRPVAAPALVLGAAWLAWFGVLQWSVVRFRVPILLTLTACTALLAWWLVRRTAVVLPRWLAPAVVLVSVALTLVVPLFSYLRGGWLTAALTVPTVGGIACAALLLVPTRWAPAAALGAAALTHTALAAVTIVGDKAPRIDVWVVLQQGADAIARGENVYTQQWTDSPGVQDFFPYLPWMAVLTAPGRWVAGDVRWMLLVWTLVLLAGLWALAGTDRARTARAAAVAAVLVLAPGTLTQVDQAWTEPVLAALLVWWAALVRRGHAWWAVLPLALACASKQHLALLAPVLLVWQPFGWRRTLATGGLTGLLVLPWVVADAGAFLGDTVTTLLTFHPIRFANTWYLYFLNEHGVTLPFAVTGAAMVAGVGAAVLAVWRRQPPVDEVLRWLALVLAVANLVNKQAFYNQFWLTGALVAASLVVPALRPGDDDPPGDVSRRGRPAAAATAR
ncbi:hypothetical protein [Phycicoccus sonneratiae]|uniref:DUF2029 domain-containing protein n=1 Tax=Phycicoccus sonneratiae TaxID=2807628 RepID=A0ABS2CRE0_9MICO|nr:hypothetical protein [Phycicoccus sonneraticus]MBM6402447.1 hypothetical protein [Phycicoccus sonneraticus]